MNYASILNPSLIRPFTLRLKLSLKAAWILGFSLVISLIGFYIFQISFITQASFTLSNLEKQIADSNREFKNLQLNLSGASSLPGFEKTLLANGYEKVGKIHYIQVLESTAVAK